MAHRHAAVEQTTRMLFSDWGSLSNPVLLAFSKRNICCYKQEVYQDIQMSVRIGIGEVTIRVTP